MKALVTRRMSRYLDREPQTCHAVSTAHMARQAGRDPRQRGTSTTAPPPPPPISHTHRDRASRRVVRTWMGSTSSFRTRALVWQCSHEGPESQRAHPKRGWLAIVHGCSPWHAGQPGPSQAPVRPQPHRFRRSTEQGSGQQPAHQIGVNEVCHIGAAGVKVVPIAVMPQSRARGCGQAGRTQNLPAGKATHACCSKHVSQWRRGGRDEFGNEQ